MANRWQCGGRDGCGTVYALKLFRCPRCHGTTFEEEKSMAKITVHGGPTNAAAGEGEPGYMSPPEAPEPAPVLVAEPASEPVPLAVEDEPEPDEQEPDDPAEAEAVDETSATGRRRNRRSSGGGGA